MAWSDLSSSMRQRLRDWSERMRERATGFPIDSVLARTRALMESDHKQARDMREAYEEMIAAEYDLSPGG